LQLNFAVSIGYGNGYGHGDLVSAATALSADSLARPIETICARAVGLLEDYFIPTTFERSIKVNCVRVIEFIVLGHFRATNQSQLRESYRTLTTFGESIHINHAAMVLLISSLRLVYRGIN
jgi:hypothetical protein